MPSIAATKEEMQLSDDITGVFDHLEPDDFAEPDTSAQHIRLPDSYDFGQFISDQLEYLKYGFAACDGRINPLTTLATSHTAVVYQADDGESLGHYITRMSSEARRLKARWVFFHKRTLVAKNDLGGEVVVDDDDLMRAARAAGTAWEAVYWYAAQGEGADPFMRHGYVSIDAHRLGDLTEAPTQPNKLLGQILKG